MRIPPQTSRSRKVGAPIIWVPLRRASLAPVCWEQRGFSSFARRTPQTILTSFQLGREAPSRLSHPSATLPRFYQPLLPLPPRGS